MQALARPRSAWPSCHARLRVLESWLQRCNHRGSGRCSRLRAALTLQQRRATAASPRVPLTHSTSAGRAPSRRSACPRGTHPSA